MYAQVQHGASTRESETDRKQLRSRGSPARDACTENPRSQVQADGAAEQRPGALAKVRTPTQLERDDHVHNGQAHNRIWCEQCARADGRDSSRIWLRLANQLNSQSYHSTASTWMTDRRRASRASRRRTVHLDVLRVRPSTTKAEATTQDPTWWVGCQVWDRSASLHVADIEPAMLALLRDVSTAMPDVEIVERASPEGDHPNNGLAEASLREVTGQARVLNHVF